MAIIGTFRENDGTFSGNVATLTFQAKVQIVPATERSNDNAPTHRVFASRMEIGAAWLRQSKEGRTYYSVKIDDPSFHAPIFANLIEGEDQTFWRLIWSRQD